ncbi:MAG: Na-K-Cl cotransporter [Candidatus Omnitrophica bacterium]|nr:Na-K-Cl cotransporter [Candidatus Omnitrophota bacterium]
METKRFGTFEGVFTPTVLSILGVVMYLRLGWAVGQVGLAGALAIIVISNLITLCTGLSVASITTNIRIGTGGAYSIISKSLGLEVGGAIGIPLYLSQAISVAFYIAGFTECWVFVFPQHSFIFVSVLTWFTLLVISYLSAKLAFRLQYIILGIIAFSLISIFLGKTSLGHSAAIWQGVGQLDFWKVFAIFFPAVTGILAGVSMSGELKEPERSIPIGTLLAIGATFFIYVAVCFWFAFAAAPQDLANNTSIVIDLARWRILVIAGIMGATLSSALSMFVASPRTLLALSKQRIIPFSSQFDYTNSKGEPAPAILLTALLALLTIFAGSLNTIAGILTMFFLITYGTLNITVFIEKITGIVSFRPTFKIPIIVSLIGGIGCLYAMFLINQLFSLVAIAVTIIIYAALVRKHIRHNLPDIRKGIFIFIAEQAVRIASQLPYHPKIWKPNLLIPVEEPRDWLGIAGFLKEIVCPRGRAVFFNIIDKDVDDKITARKKYSEELALVAAPLKEEGIFVSTLVVDSKEFLDGAITLMQALIGSGMPPNVLFIKLGLNKEKDHAVKELIIRSEAMGLGIMVFTLHPKLVFGQKQVINLWIRRMSPNIHLTILIGLQLERNWEGRLRIIQVVCDANEKQETESYLYKLKKLMRLTRETEIVTIVGSFEEGIANAPLADINIFGISKDHDIPWMRNISGKINTSALFLKDSNQENAVV